MYYTKALVLAQEYHSGQRDKAGNAYILHPLAVSEMGDTVPERIVGLLHDLVEDTDYSEIQLRRDFPDFIADAVMSVTRIPEELYKDFILRAKADPIGRHVKINDIKHNTMNRGIPCPPHLLGRYKEAMRVLLND